jgi:hypothetical protein
MNRHGPEFGFGMFVSLILGIATAEFIWGLSGASPSFFTFVVGFLIGALWWGLLRRLFFVLGAMPGYLTSSARREFRHAWKVVGCRRRLRKSGICRLWETEDPGTKFYHWLKEEWMLDKVVTGVSAIDWLTRLVKAADHGSVLEFWHSRPDTSDARMSMNAYIARRTNRFFNE